MSNETPLKTLTSFRKTFHRSIRKKFNERYQSWKSMLGKNFNYMESSKRENPKLVLRAFLSSTLLRRNVTNITSILRNILGVSFSYA